MNLPAHGTTSLDPRSHHCVQITHVAQYLQHYRLAQPKRRQAKFLYRPPGRTPLLPGAKPLLDHCFSDYWLAEYTVPLGAMQCRDTPGDPIAWRTHLCRQVLYQQHISASFGP